MTHDILIKKYIDRAMDEVPVSLLERMHSLPPKVAVFLMVTWGKQLLADDEWEKTVKKLKPTMKEKLLWTIKKFTTK
jgi:hypothetical protein